MASVLASAGGLLHPLTNPNTQPERRATKTLELFHFTSSHLEQRIKAEGLWRGRLPWHRDPFTGAPCCIRHMNETRMSQMDLRKLDQREALEYEANIARKRLDLVNDRKVRPVLHRWRRPGFQWLTSSPDWAQPFAVLGTSPFPKNARRITVAIPDVASHRLHRWTKMCYRGQPDSAAELNTSEVDFDNWWVFYGPVPPTWFKEIAANPGQQIIPEIHGQ